MSHQAYRDGWDRTFAPKAPPKPPPIIRCPFPIRRGVQIELTIPKDLVLADLPRLMMYLVTMCNDWDIDKGMPDFQHVLLYR